MFGDSKGAAFSRKATGALARGGPMPSLGVCLKTLFREHPAVLPLEPARFLVSLQHRRAVSKTLGSVHAIAVC